MAKKHKITQPKIVFISRTSEKYSKHFFPSARMRESAEDFPLSSHTLDTHRLRKSRFKRCLECFPSRFSSHYVPENRTYCSGFAINFSVSSSSSLLSFFGCRWVSFLWQTGTNERVVNFWILSSSPGTYPSGERDDEERWKFEKFFPNIFESLLRKRSSGFGSKKRK